MSRPLTFAERFGPGGFTGTTFRDWVKILYHNHYAIDVRYWPRAAVITLNSVINSLASYWEDFRYAAKVEQTSIPPPVFVLGIWRSGTTHLHNLLSQDDRFAFPNTFQVLYPHTFLFSEAWSARAVQWFTPSTRPMDNVKSGIGEPQEDEFALTVSGLSMMIGAMCFPRTGQFYRRFLTLLDATPAEIDSWKSHLLWFVRKLTLKYDRPLILKSPGHTARIKILLELFPQAKFVHIHRHPHAVFQSTLHMQKKATPFWALQKSEPAVERIIQDYVEVYDAFFEQRPLIPAENFCEISYDQLDQNPLATVEQIYRQLRLPEFADLKPKLCQYIESLSGYSKNTFTELPADIRERVGREWSRCFEEWQYAK